MHQCLLFSSVFLIFVVLLTDLITVVDTAEAKDDDINLKTENAFSEVIKNITRVNDVLQELIKNYEELQKIYQSQESIEQYEYDKQNSPKNGNVQRSKEITTPEKPRDFPATNMPYLESESQEKMGDNKNVSKDKSDESRVPTVMGLKDINNITEANIKVKTKKAKPLKPERVMYTSGENTDEQLADVKKMADEREASNNQKQSIEKPHENHQAEQTAILEHGNHAMPNLSMSNIRAEPSTVSKVVKNKVTPRIENKKEFERKVDEADSDNEMHYAQRPDDNDEVVHKFATKTKDECHKPISKHKQRSVFNRFTTEEKDDIKAKSAQNKSNKLTHTATVRSKKNKKSLYKSSKLSSQGVIKTVIRELDNQKQESPKKRGHKEDNQDESRQKEGHRKKKRKENAGSSEDEKSLEKEQFKTSILRKAYGDACLKVLVKKCYKACKSTLERGCRKFKCTSNYQLQFKEDSKTGCINEFRDPPRSEGATVVTDKRLVKSAKKTKVRAKKYAEEDFHGYSDLSGNGYLAAACLPKSSHMNAGPRRSHQQLNILRDRFERACQKVSRRKCYRACSYAVSKTCSTHSCAAVKKRGLKKICRRECKESYSSRPKNKMNGSSKSSESESQSEHGASSSSDSSTDVTETDTDTGVSLEEKTHKKGAASKTTQVTRTTQGTKEDEAMRLRMRSW